MPSLPMYLFAVIALLASGLVTLLPETYNNNLPNTIAEAEEIGREKLQTKTNGTIDN